MPISEIQYRSALLRSDFALFLRFAIREVLPRVVYLHNWHIDAFLYELDRIKRGENRSLIVTVPPRHLKSFTITTAWVAWMLGLNPALRFVTVSYNLQLAEKLARDCLQIINSPWYKAAFPDLKLTKRSVLDFETSMGGGRLSTSLDGVLTGRGADITIIDDPMKSADISSEAIRTAAIEWLFNTALQRFNDQTKGVAIIVQQRLHTKDLVGELLYRSKEWHELRLPAIATEDEYIRIGRGPNDIHFRREGEALDPQRVPLSELYKIRDRDLPSWNAQHQQQPAPEMGNWVNPSWFLYYEEPPTGGTVVLSLDTACKEGLNTDYSVGIVARYVDDRFYILDMYRERVDFFDLRADVDRLCLHHRVERLLIEDRASGTQLISMLRREKRSPHTPGPIACMPVASKLVRFHAHAGSIQRGDVVLPRNRPFVSVLLEEVAAFPNGRHDDIADALSQLLANRPPNDRGGNLAGPELFPPDGPANLDYAPNPWNAESDRDPWSGL